jgi:anti-sigma regulatory factor (Ser/Thr protein kinase)
LLFNKINRLRKENQYNQAILTLLEACCDGIYQNYTLKISGELNKVDAYAISENRHHVLATSENFLYINQVGDTRNPEERRIEFPTSRLSSLITVTDRKGARSAFVGSECGEVWHINITKKGDAVHTVKKKQTEKSNNKIFSFTINRNTLAYSPIGDPSIHLYHLPKKKKSLLKKHNYKNVAQVQFFENYKDKYCALGYTDQEKEVPLLSLYNNREDFIWGVEEVEGSVKALRVIQNKDGEIIILAATEKSALYAVDLKGNVKWKFKTDGAINCMVVSYRPETKEPYIFIGGEGGTLYLLDSSKVLKWKKVFNSAIKDLTLAKISETHYPHIIVGLSDNTISSFFRSPAEVLAPIFRELFLDILNEENCSEELMIDHFTKSDYQLIRDFGEIRSFGFDNAPALLILQFTHLARPLEEIIELIMPHKPSAKSLARLAEFRLNYEKRKSAYDLKMRKRFENLYQRGDLRDAFSTGCQLAYQSSNLQWTTQLPQSIDHLMVVDQNRFLMASEERAALLDRLIPSKDTSISLPSKIVACFHTRKEGCTDNLTPFAILTKDYKIRYCKLPLREVKIIDIQINGKIKGETKEKSVTILDNLFSFSTSDKICYIYYLSSKKAELIKSFETDYQTTAATFFLQEEDIRIALGTRAGKILAYKVSKGDLFAINAEEPAWSADIEGMVECIASATNSRGETLIIAGSSTGAARAFDFDGNLLWEFRTITDKLQPGRGIRSITTVGGQQDSTMYAFLLAGDRLYVVNEDGRLTKIFAFPEIALRLDLIEASKVEQPSFLVLFANYKLNHITFYLKNPLSHELQNIYQTLVKSEGEERFFMDLIANENTCLQAFAFQQATQLVKSYSSVKDMVLSAMKNLYQKDPALRRVIIKSLENILAEEWDASLLQDNIDFDDIYQFSGMISLLEKVGKSSKANSEKVIDFLKTIYSITKREANHIAILQLLEELLKDNPPALAQFLFDITPFENSRWVSQEIGLILGRILGKAYVKNFYILNKCFYVSSTNELKAFSREIKDNLNIYEEKLTESSIKALKIFTTINWDEKERMDEPFKTELKQLKRILNTQSQNIATALFHKWERILKNVSAEEIKLSDLSVKAWHKVESLNSHVRHSIVEGCFSGLESFTLMLKDKYGDQDIVNGINNSIKQLPMVRKTLTDYFDGCIDGEVRLKDIFFLEYKTIFKELDEIEKLSYEFGDKLNDTLYRNEFSKIIPEKTRNIQRKNLSAIDLTIKRLKTDVRTILENLFENSLIKQALNRASISVDFNLTELDDSKFRILAREHELLNAFYEIINNAIKHACKNVGDGRDKKITISAECYSEDNLYLKIRIADNGIGMTPHELSRIRDISFTKGGTGEGIERVYQLIENNLGKVQYQSEKGKGTAVLISLPLKIRKEI